MLELSEVGKQVSRLFYQYTLILLRRDLLEIPEGSGAMLLQIPTKIMLFKSMKTTLFTISAVKKTLEENKNIE